MKTFRSSKLLALILAIALCFGAMYTTAFAAETDAASAEVETPKIISQNVKYGGNFSLMFAIEAASCSGETVTLKVYDEMPTDTSKPRWTGTQTSSDELVNVNGIPSYVFTTPGVAAKDMDVNYYVVAESAGVKSEVKKYSVAEYLYERLYGDQTAFAPDAIGKAQADLYKSVLQMGKDAQDLLFNHDDNPDNDRTTFVTDLYYVACAASATGTSAIINGSRKGVLTDGSEALTITSSYASKAIAITWNIKCIDKDGNISILRDQEIKTVTPTSHMILTPADALVFPAAYDMNNVSSVGTGYIKTGQSETTKVSLGEYNGSKAAKIDLTKTGKFYEYFNYFNDNQSGATHAIFDTDITFLPVFSDGYDSAYLLFQLCGKAADGSTNTHKSTSLYIIANKDGSMVVATGTGASATKMPISGSTVHISVIYYSEIIDGVKKMVADTYINGEFFFSVKSSLAYTNSTNTITRNEVGDLGFVSIVPEKLPLDTGTVIYQDNLICTKLAPMALADTTYDSGAHAIDGWTSIPKSFADGSTSSIVEYNNSSAIKFDMSSSSNEKINFYTQSAEAGADLFVFETDISVFHPVRTIIRLYDKDGKEFYNFVLNGRGGLTAESNSISWKNPFYPQGETFKLRIEIRIDIEKNRLDINVYANDVLVPQPSSYGKGTINGNIVFSLDPVSIEGISKITFEDNENNSSSPDGYIIFDNIKMEAIDTTN